MTNPLIPAEAIEAAARVMLDKMYDDKTLRVDDEDRDIMRAALEAAAPYMLAGVLDLHQEDLFRGHLSNGCKTCSGGEWPCATIAAVAAGGGGE